jgi:5-methylthioadenosine/S-adenosylhomocysteine deaminase
MYVHPRPGLGDAVAGAMHDAGIRGVMARGYVTAGADVGVPRRWSRTWTPRWATHNG